MRGKHDRFQGQGLKAQKHAHLNLNMHFQGSKLQGLGPSIQVEWRTETKTVVQSKLGLGLEFMKDCACVSGLAVQKPAPDPEERSRQTFLNDAFLSRWVTPPHTALPPCLYPCTASGLAQVAPDMRRSRPRKREQGGRWQRGKGNQPVKACPSVCPRSRGHKIIRQLFYATRGPILGWMDSAGPLTQSKVWLPCPPLPSPLFPAPPQARPEEGPKRGVRRADRESQPVADQPLGRGRRSGDGGVARAAAPPEHLQGRRIKQIHQKQTTQQTIQQQHN